MTLRLIGYAALLAVAGCNSQPGKEEAKMVLATDTSSSGEPVRDTQPRERVPANIQVDSIIQLAFPVNSNSVTVKGHVGKKGDPVICLLPVVRGSKLTATVKPENEKANIRFSHIHLPGGRSDGPFGPTLKYDLKGKGLYKIYVAPNQMAGDPVSTDFTLMIKVD